MNECTWKNLVHLFRVQFTTLNVYFFVLSHNPKNVIVVFFPTSTTLMGLKKLQSIVIAVFILNIMRGVTKLWHIL